MITAKLPIVRSQTCKYDTMTHGGLDELYQICVWACVTSQSGQRDTFGKYLFKKYHKTKYWNNATLQTTFKKKKEINSSSHVFNKDLDEFWVQNLFFPQNIICFSRTPPIVQPMQKKKKKNPYWVLPSKNCNLTPLLLWKTSYYGQHVLNLLCPKCCL